MLKKLMRKKQRIESIEKGFEIANYSPVPYEDTVRWSSFQNKAESEFEKIIAKLNLDDLCYEVLDSIIDAEAARNKMSLKAQYSRHMYTLFHDAGILAGEINKAERHITLLEEDRDKLAKEIDALCKKRS